MAKQKETETPNQIRDIRQHPRWIAAMDKLARLRTLRATKHAALVEFEQHRPDHFAAGDTDVSKRSREILENVTGDQLPEPVLSPKHGDFLLEVRAVDDAISRFEASLGTLRSELQAEIYTAWQDEYTAVASKIAHDTAVLKATWDELSTLVEAMFSAGAIASPHGHSLCNFASCAGLPRVLRAMSLEKFRRDNATVLE